MLSEHLILHTSTPIEALNKLNNSQAYSVLIIVDEEGRLKGSLTDGDIRRGVLSGLTLQDSINKYVQNNPKSWSIQRKDYRTLYNWRDNNYNVIPYVDDKNRVIKIINFRIKKSFIPADVVIMAGGIGSRLRPLTYSIPKPLLKIGSKSIIEHNIDRLSSFGITNFHISVNYLKEQIISKLGDGREKGIKIKYIEEDKPLGTIGALSQIQTFENDHIIVMNSDILTNLNFEKLFLHFIEQNAKATVCTVPYEIKIPYGVVETENGKIIDLKEKPTYTYYSNAGIYMLGQDTLNQIPKNEKYDAPELILDLCNNKENVSSYPILEYWLDIGKHEDYERAQKDIMHLKF